MVEEICTSLKFVSVRKHKIYLNLQYISVDNSVPILSLRAQTKMFSLFVTHNNIIYPNQKCKLTQNKAILILVFLESITAQK